VTTPLLGQQILGKQTAAGRRKHILVDTRMDGVFCGSTSTLHNEDHRPAGIIHPRGGGVGYLQRSLASSRRR
jgi:hypothetical protein